MSESPVWQSELSRRLPQRLGPVLLECELGVGSMGAVYRGRMEDPLAGLPAGSPVAVKVLHSALLQGGGDFQRRFHREARIGASVVHPAVVRTYSAESAELEGVVYHFLLLEFAEGQTLRALMDQLLVLPEPLVRDLGAQIARGLDAIHRAGALHRDLKPQNVLITPDHLVKLMDLGIARLLDESHPLTRFGEFVGSPAYAAPEQFGEARLGPAADLYSLGTVLYEAATGHQPFQARGFNAIMRRHLEQVPSRAGELNPQLTPFLEEVLARLLEKEPERRFPTASDLAGVLERGEASPWWLERERGRHRARSTTLSRLIRMPRETALLGREAELGELKRVFQQAREGSGGVVLIEGEAGVGKTRLIDEFIRRLPTEPDPVHVLYGSNAPGVALGSRGALAQAVVEQFGAADLEARLRPYLSDTRRLAGAFAAYLAQGPNPPPSEPLVSDALHAAFCELARGLAAERTVIWIVEDLHFASADSRAILLSLARIAHDRPLFLVATTRSPLPADEMTQFERAGLFRRLALSRLSARDVVLLLGQALHSEALAERLGGMVALKSDGNPFFVFEMLRELKERGVLQERPDGWHADTLAMETIEVPSSIQEMFRARLKDLDDRDQDLLDVASIQGFAFDPDLCARVLERKRLEILQSLARIERRTGNVRATGAGFEFDHHQLQETIYSALPPMLRTEYHGLTAQAFETREGLRERPVEAMTGEEVVFLAEHFLRGNRLEPGLRLALRAVEELRARYRHEALLSFLELATGAVGGGQPGLRAALKLAEASCCDHLGRREGHKKAVAEAIEAAEESGVDDLRVQARLAEGTLYWRMGEYEEARRILTLVLERAQSAEPSRLEREIRMRLGTVLTSLGRFDEAREHLERGVEIARALGDRDGEAAALGNLANIFYLTGAQQRARAIYEQQLALSREIGNRMRETVATGNIGAVLVQLGQLDTARSFRMRYLELSREIGNREGEAIALLSLGEIALLEGAFPEAEARIRQGLAHAREFGQVRIESWGLLLEAQLLAQGGEMARACELLLSLVDAPPARVLPAVEAMAQFLLGRCLLESGKRDEAVGRFRRAEEVSSRLRLDAPGPLPAAYLSWVGEHDPSSVAVPARHAVAVRAECHLVLYRSGGGERHLEVCRDLLGRLSEHLSSPAREAFWRGNPIARKLREVTAA